MKNSSIHPEDMLLQKFQKKKISFKIWNNTIFCNTLYLIASRSTISTSLESRTSLARATLSSLKCKRLLCKQGHKVIAKWHWKSSGTQICTCIYVCIKSSLFLILLRPLMHHIRFKIFQNIFYLLKAFDKKKLFQKIFKGLWHTTYWLQLIRS